LSLRSSWRSPEQLGWSSFDLDSRGSGNKAYWVEQFGDKLERRGIVTPLTPLDSGGAGGRDAGGFPTTHWSVVMRAGTATTVDSMAALDRLCHQYWQPLYYFVRRRGFTAADAPDLPQRFFARPLGKGFHGGTDAR